VFAALLLLLLVRRRRGAHNEQSGQGYGGSASLPSETELLAAGHAAAGRGVGLDVDDEVRLLGPSTHYQQYTAE
jgi:hypothetical protein